MNGRVLLFLSLSACNGCPSSPPAADAAPPPPPAEGGGSGCMGACPTAPAGCERTTIDPGSCSNSACSAPLPVCHYARLLDAGDGVVCPATLVGRCIAP
jgi:hypothetical protein